MHSVVASCIASCATTIILNAVLGRKRHRRAARADPQQREGPEPAAHGADGAYEPSIAACSEQDARDVVEPQHGADQGDDEFFFTPHKAARPQRAAGPPPCPGPYSLQSPINVSKRADPYDPAPRTR